ncbi:MAG: imidazolonepropionase [Saprospiraceae bacterium]|nr:imidazolonepropionase [Saprospiraceae bacterium]
MTASSLLIKNIGKLILASHTSVPFKKGKELSNLPQIEHAFLEIENEKIKSFGSMDELPSWKGEIMDAQGGYILPAFVDCHTHLVFADWRNQEFVDRIHGLTYQEISSKGGGILNSAKKLAALSEDELYDRSAQRLTLAIKKGTGAIEIKSGYGLNTENELKILRVIQRLKQHFPIPIKATFLGAHSFPLEFREHHQAYIQQIIHEMLPEIEKHNLADYCDVFCEQNFYSPDETDQILEAATKHGLKARIHTNQFTHSGGIDIALKHHAVSVDHLEVCNDDEIQKLKDTNTHPVLLPAAAFFMNLEYPPARRMIDQGLGVILASDFNPGTSPSSNMSFVLSLACIKMRMTPEEAIQAMTINAAHNLEIAQEVGSIESGKIANLILTGPIPGISYLPYAFGDSWFTRIFIRGNPDF